LLIRPVSLAKLRTAATNGESLRIKFYLLKFLHIIHLTCAPYLSLRGGSRDMLHSGFSTRLITSAGKRLAACSLTLLVSRCNLGSGAVSFLLVAHCASYTGLGYGPSCEKLVRHFRNHGHGFLEGQLCKSRASGLLTRSQRARTNIVLGGAGQGTCSSSTWAELSLSSRESTPPARTS